MLGKFKRSHSSGEFSSIIVHVNRSKGSITQGILRCSSFRRSKATTSVSRDEQNVSAPSSDRDDLPLIPSMDNTAETSGAGSFNSGALIPSMDNTAETSGAGSFHSGVSYYSGPSHSDVCTTAELSAHDDKGRCPRHPRIQLLQKTRTGDWQVLWEHCPDCCIEQRRRRKNAAKVKSVRSRELDCELDCCVEETSDTRVEAQGLQRSSSSSSSSRQNRSGSGRGSSKGRTGRNGRQRSGLRSTLLPISELTIRSVGSSTSEITYDDRSNQCSCPSTSRSLVHSTSSVSQTRAPRVTRMLLKDAYGDRGWYTGEVARNSGLPHGRGTMHYCAGRKRGGWWSHGLAGGSRVPEEEPESEPDDDLISLFSCTRMQSFRLEDWEDV